MICGTFRYVTAEVKNGFKSIDKFEYPKGTTKLFFEAFAVRLNNALLLMLNPEVRILRSVQDE